MPRAKIILRMPRASPWMIVAMPKVEQPTKWMGRRMQRAHASNMDDVKSPSKEDGAVADVGDAKDGAMADSKGEPLGEGDAKGGAKEDVADEK